MVIASRNGLPGVELAYQLMQEHSTDPLEAAIEAVKIQEQDLLTEKSRQEWLHWRASRSSDDSPIVGAGQYGSATMYEPTNDQKKRNAGLFAIANRDGVRLEPMSFLFTARQRP